MASITEPVAEDIHVLRAITDDRLNADPRACRKPFISSTLNPAANSVHGRHGV